MYSNFLIIVNKMKYIMFLGVRHIPKHFETLVKIDEGISEILARGEGV